MGIVLALVIEKLTEHYTAVEGAPVTECAKSAKTGPATIILSGFASGLESSVWSVVAICAAILGAMLLFPGNAAMAAYGVALAGLGLLSTTGFMLAMDTYGPISDNANGIFEMSGALETEEAKKPSASGLTGDRIVHRLDAVGNTTKALTKGFAIATAVIAAVSLFHSFVEDAQLYGAHVAQKGLPIDVPEIFIGLLIGGAAPYLFSAFSINAVGRAAFELIELNFSGKKIIVRNGTPTDCVIMGARHILLPTLPDLVLSGVNKGRNVAEDVVYSGTIAGALEGTILGLPSFALSQEFSLETRDKPLWETALKFGPQILRKVIDAGVPKNTVINVNFPACAPEEVRGVRVTRQGKRNLGFLKVDKRHDGRGNPYFWIGFERAAMMDTPAEGTDLAALAARYVSVTPLRLDRTNDEFSEALTATLK